MIPQLSEKAIENSRIKNNDVLYPRFCKALRKASMQDFEKIWKAIFIGNDNDVDQELKKAGF